MESRAGGVAQAIKHLPRKLKTLSSNPSTVKKKKKQTPALLYHFALLSAFSEL
jgi:hypothetical protein